MTSSRPKKILLATDMSARCDRALVRSAMLASEWGAELAIAYAVEKDAAVDQSMVPSWRRKENALDIFKEKIRQELSLDGLADTPLHVMEGDPEQVVLSVARQEQSDLIITGVARDNPFGRMRIGTTPGSLASHADAPVLVVKKRASHPYKNIVVATDLSDPSKAALHAAVKLFGAENITVFYAYSVSFADAVEEKDKYILDMAKAEKETLDQFVAETLGQDVAAKVKTMVEYGSPGDLLTQYATDHQVDLVVSGTHGRTGISSVLLGSVADTILNMVPTDIMIVRK